jgi:3-hydroxy-9,10-secoandrosta-1,3,5(10)-triene-9,17-dione monooxygenase reductase component
LHDIFNRLETVKAMNSKEFRSVMGCFMTGVTVVTANFKNKKIGITANSVSSVSLDPPLVLWSLSKSSQKHIIMTSVKNYAINILSKSQKQVATQFSQTKEPFSGLDIYFSVSGVPLIKNSVAILECEQHAVYDGGDHSIILGLVTSFNESKHEPLTFFKGQLN